MFDRLLKIVNLIAGLAFIAAVAVVLAIFARRMFQGAAGQADVYQVLALMMHVDQNYHDLHGIVETATYRDHQPTTRPTGAPPPQVITATYELLVKQPDKFAAIVHRNAPNLSAEEREQVVIANGTRRWEVYPATNAVAVYDNTPTERSRISFAWPDPLSMILPRPSTFTQFPGRNVALRGVERVAGRDAYRIEVPALSDDALPQFPPYPVPESGQLTARQVFSVDTATGIILRQEIRFENGIVGVSEFTRIEINSSLPDEAFVFHPGANTWVMNRAVGTPGPPSPDDIRRSLTFPALLPAYLPSGVQLARTAVSPEFPQRGNLLVLWYIGPPATDQEFTFSIEEAPIPATPTPLPGNAHVQNITVHGLPAKLIEYGRLLPGTPFGPWSVPGGPNFGPGPKLQWAENGILVSLYGILSREEFIKVAESMR